MKIDHLDIRSARPSLPHAVTVTLTSGKTVVVDVKDWLNSDNLNKALLVDPGLFSRGYKSTGGGIEWAHGPHLTPHTLADLINKQSLPPAKEGD
jgi:Protein of unknown function (DUF2442)